MYSGIPNCLEHSGNSRKLDIILPTHVLRACIENKGRGIPQNKVCSAKTYPTFPKMAFLPSSHVRRERHRVFLSTPFREGVLSTCSAERPASQGCLKVERRAALRRESRSAGRRRCSSFRFARFFFWALSFVFPRRRHHPLNCEKNLMRWPSPRVGCSTGFRPRLSLFYFRDHSAASLGTREPGSPV